MFVLSFSFCNDIEHEMKVMQPRYIESCSGLYSVFIIVESHLRGWIKQEHVLSKAVYNKETIEPKIWGFAKKKKDESK